MIIYIPLHLKNKHILPKNYKHSSLTKIPLLENGQIALPSNAYNFHGAWDDNVDPRTGNSQFSMTVATSTYNNATATRKLNLIWTGNGTRSGPDFFTMGPHWNWNISHETTSATEIAGHMTIDIILGNGHGFTMINDTNSKGIKTWHLFRHKLKDVVVTGHPGDWLVNTSDGIRQHIHDGYEDWEEIRDGHRLWLYYDKKFARDGTRRLKYICSHTLSNKELNKSNSCQGKGVEFFYSGNFIFIKAEQNIVLKLQQSSKNKQISEIILPTLNYNNTEKHNKKTHIFFTYDTQNNRSWLLKNINYPNGMISTFLYNEESSRSKNKIPGLPLGINGAFLPVVTEQISHDKNHVIPDKHTWYQYGKGTKNNHNYLGYQSNTMSIPGHDNLLDRNDNYKYQVTVDDGLTSITTTYNKYHLPVKIVNYLDKTNENFSEILPTYAPWIGTSFKNLSATYLFPKKTTSHTYSLNESGVNKTIKPKIVITNKKYNDYGQVIWQQDAYGRQTFMQYCPLQGDIHCPVMDKNQPQYENPEKILILPAASKNDEVNVSENTCKCNYYYYRL